MTPDRYNRVTEIFTEVSARPEGERAGYLDAACGADRELRAEIESLLRHHVPEPTPAPAKAPEARRPAVRWSTPALVLAAGVAASALLVALQAWTLDGMQASLSTQTARELQGALDLRVGVLRAWAGRQKDRLQAVSRYPAFVQDVRALLRQEELTDPGKSPGRTPAHDRVREFLGGLPRDLAGRGYVVLSPSGNILASHLDRMVGGAGAPPSGNYIRRALLGEFVISRPYKDTDYLVGEGSVFERPVLFVGGPIRDDAGKILAIVSTRFDSESGFADFAKQAAAGAELLTFDDKGVLLSEPRDPEGLQRLGLLPGSVPVQAAIAARLVDPGGDLSRGFRPPVASDQWPMTRMCASAVSGKSGVDSSGYRSLRGREVLGAWAWLPDWELGVAVERDLEEALLPAARVRTAFHLLLGAVVVATISIGFLSRRFEMQKRLQGDQFGSYVLERKIGRGGMAEIYLAHHALLRRPTAVKVIEGKDADDRAVARFEREARIASSLNHPNTIQIFDYGRSSDGRFYIAMEYVEGLNLAQLVSLAGPLPASRAVYLLGQICGSLEEAHAAGLVHRDIKPANIMVGRRGVKVLDFGIARSVKEGTSELTQPNQISGTPVYLAPERIRSPHTMDPRSDVYSVGAVAFYLLTGRNVFEGAGPSEVLFQVMTVEAPAPSRLRGSELPPELDRLVLDCLAKDPEKRPPGAAALADALGRIPLPDRWGPAESRAWWTENDGRVRALLEASRGPTATSARTSPS